MYEYIEITIKHAGREFKIKHTLADTPANAPKIKTVDLQQAMSKAAAESFTWLESQQGALIDNRDIVDRNKPPEPPPGFKRPKPPPPPPQ